jgi:integrase
MARQTLTDRGVEALKPRAKRYAFSDPQQCGHYIRVQPSGIKSFTVITHDPSGRQQWITIGRPGLLSLAEARERAREIIKRIKTGQPAREARAATFAAVVENWRKRHVEKNKLRSAKEMNRLLDRHILPVWRDREFVTIRKSDIAALLDDVEDDHGARQADYCLTIIRMIANWYASRDDDYSPPLFRGQRRQSPHAQRRARILTDQELQAVWAAAEASGTFGALIRLLLLSAQRRDKVLQMKFVEVADDGTWTIPKAPREKDNAGELLLPEMALTIIRAQPQLGDNPFVFAGRADGPISGISKFKRRLDTTSGVSGWTLHDLRRTARSLMSRAGVRPDIGERVLGHALLGVAGVYDRHGWRDEKADALAKLAALLDAIVHERTGDNVTRMRAKRR